MTNYNDGNWHIWDGGECPVHPKSMVEAVWHDPRMERAGMTGPRVTALVEAAKNLADEVVEYGRINQLGDGEQKHNVKQVRAALRAIGGEA